MKFRLSVIGFFFVVAVLAVQLCAQLTGDTVTVPSFLKKEKNVIEFNDADWSVLFDGMVRLQNDTDTVPRVVAMVHIGDSHVQAGFLTEAVRLPLQRRFGDAGRGLVVPLKLAKTNEPRDYSVVADGSWNFSRCVGRKYSNYTPGVGGIAIVPRNGRIDLTVSTLSKTDDCAGFKKVRLFHAPVDSFPGVISEPFLVEGETRLPFLTHFRGRSPCVAFILREKPSRKRRLWPFMERALKPVRAEFFTTLSATTGLFTVVMLPFPVFPSRWQHSRRRLLFCRWVRMSRFPPL